MQRTPSRRRQSGYHILEILVSIGVLVAAMAILAVTFQSLTQRTVELQQSQAAENQVARLRAALQNDLTSIDTAATVQTAVPEVEVRSVNGGTNNSIRVRTVVGFESIADNRRPVYGPAVEYRIERDGKVVRSQSGEDIVVANRVRWVQYSVAATGVVTVNLITYADYDDSDIDVASRFQIAPRGSMGM